MNGSYGNNLLSSFNLPPPNHNPSPASWKNEWKPNQNPQASSMFPQIQHCFPGQQSMSVKNDRSSQSLTKNEFKEHIYPVSNGEVSSIGVPPPPLPGYSGTTYIGSNTQHMYANSSVATGLTYQGAVTYLSFPAETFAQNGYYPPPPPPPPIRHNPPPPPPPQSRYSAMYFQRSFYYNKRKLPCDRTCRKKKKPLSQNNPHRRDWPVADAKRALELEKEYNKRNRSASLIIKFPDIELSRDLVAKFHPSIDTVHFQQPSTPRFCFVTLKDGVNVEEILEKLQKTKFGQGYLSVEYKKDRDDEVNIGPEDIDPLTLYVGNLAQEVIKEDMVRIYPKHRRVDIGYARKMRNTRYAFVTFKNIEDSCEAFKRTHSTQLYSKSLIVRFRRLNGTVGMPGEPKPQYPQKHNDNDRPHYEASNCDDSSELSPWDMVDVSQWDTDHSIKQESLDDISDDENEDLDDMFSSLPDIAQKIFSDIERKPISKIAPPSNRFSSPTNRFSSPSNRFSSFLSHASSGALSPIPSVHLNDEKLSQDTDEKKPILSEDLVLQNSGDTITSDLEKNLLQSDEEIEEKLAMFVDKKPTGLVDKKPTGFVDEKPSDLVDQKPLLPIQTNLSTVSNRSGPIHKPFIEPKKETGLVDEGKIETEYHTLSVEHSFCAFEIKSEVEEKTSVNTEVNIPSVEIKKEDVGPSSEMRSQAELDVSLVAIKNEPVDQDEQINGDNEEPIDEEDDFDFGNLLSSLDEKTKKLSKLKEMLF